MHKRGVGSRELTQEAHFRRRTREEPWRHGWIHKMTKLGQAAAPPHVAESLQASHKQVYDMARLGSTIFLLAEVC